MEMNLPDDILFSILCILPVKSLMRLLCLCKSWNSLIKSSGFIAAHHHHNENEKNSYLLYMPKDVRKPRQVCTMLRENDAPPSYMKHCDLVLPLSRYYVVGVCEGLICLTEESFDVNHIYIWNPFVGTLKFVPPSETAPPPHGDNRIVFGFGFANNDYRIIKIIYHEWRLHEVEMYSLATNSWRRIEFEPAKWWIDFQCIGVSFEGSIYWLSSVDAEYGASKSILRFDLEEEIFEETAAPPAKYHRSMALVVANGFLVLLELRALWIPFPVQSWVMKESSWIATEEFIISEDRSHPMVELCKSGNLVFATIDGSRPPAEIQDQRVFFAYDYNRISGWKLREMEIEREMDLSWRQWQTYDFVRMRFPFSLTTFVGPLGYLLSSRRHRLVHHYRRRISS
ncbi:hypothetical protein BUALT_Bualt18G0044900 [Buddleja alternifolia]|uniref:F-box domain-containing protein n=1 Tax=Buddleja alternifolia TaxID=168488 RepID=A0AAV6WCU7_9LAMI|nr:hypothetical protein BUALT_Bualt18G0044900 [Buddleja alternifolia]